MTVEAVEHGGVRLRPYRETDADDVAAACADSLTRRFIPAMPHPYTRERALEWINGGAPAVRAAGGVAYAIADPATDRLIGGIGVERLVPARRQGEIGYWVAPWARGRGVATAATRTLADSVLADAAPPTGAGPALTADLGPADPAGDRAGHSPSRVVPRLDRLELLTEWENVASQRVALAAGFRREGVRRAAGLGADGRRYDLVAFARLAGDPTGPVPRMLPDLPELTTDDLAGAGATLASQAVAGQPPARTAVVDRAPTIGRRALTDGVVTLRPLGPADTDFYFALQSQPDVVATSVPPVPPTPGGVALRCARAGARWLAGEQADLVVVDTVSGRPAGTVALFYEQPGLREAMVAYSMLSVWRGRGYPTRAVRLLSRWAFAEAGIARLFGGTLPDNLGSQRVLEKAGFRREGVLRGQLPGLGGVRADDVVFGLLPGDSGG